MRAKVPGAAASAIPLPPVRIIVHPAPVRVNYQVVRSLVPVLWDPSYAGRKIDYVVHIGMAGPRLFYALERQGHRDGYNMKDVDGELLRDDKRREEEGKDWVWYGTPPTIETDLDTDDIMKRWQKYSPVSPHASWALSCPVMRRGVEKKLTRHPGRCGPSPLD